MMRNLYVAYEDTYVPTKYKGMIGVINEKWAMTTSIEEEVQKGRIVYKANYIFIPILAGVYYEKNKRVPFEGVVESKNLNGELEVRHHIKYGRFNGIIRQKEG